jgi:hypothetical protein
VVQFPFLGLVIYFWRRGYCLFGIQADSFLGKAGMPYDWETVEFAQQGHELEEKV